MPFDSEDSGSEPDVSVLEMARARNGVERQANTMEYDNQVLSPEHYDVEDTSIEEQVVEEEEVDDDNEEAIHLVDPAAIGLKEISNLGRFTVSSHKPGNGVDELRNDDLKLYWQCVSPVPTRRIFAEQTFWVHASLCAFSHCQIANDTQI